MVLKLIQKLVALMERGKLSELEIEDKDSGLKVRLKGESAFAATHAAPMVHVVHGGGAAAPVAGHAPAMNAGVPAAEVPKPVKQGTTINSPMVGTFYRAASPGAEPFVDVGNAVKVGQRLCIVEAMKILNEIECDHAGVVTRVLVQDGEAVEYGQPLFEIE